MDVARPPRFDRWTELEVRCLLTELEQVRVEIRRSLRRGALITTSAITAEGLVLAYSISGGQPKSILGMTAVPVIIGATAIILIQEDFRRRQFKSYARTLEDELSGKSDVQLSGFGWEAYQSENEINETIPTQRLFSYLTGAVYVGLSLYVVLLLPSPDVLSAANVDRIAFSTVLGAFYATLFAAMLYTYSKLHSDDHQSRKPR